MKTLSITSHRMMADNVAQVVVAFTGEYKPEELRDALTAKLDMKAAPIEGTFRQITAGAAVGFVRAHKEVRVVEPSELRASYRVMSSNMMMDNADRSLWDLQSNAGAVFLTRHGNEDLSELVASATFHGRQDVPRASRLTAARAAQNEVVAFVNEEGVLDHGFVLEDNGTSCKVEARLSGTTEVPYSMVASAHDVALDETVCRGVMKELRASLPENSKAQAKDYYRKLFAYAPEYMQKVFDMIDGSAVA